MKTQFKVTGTFFLMLSACYGGGNLRSALKTAPVPLGTPTPTAQIVKPSNIAGFNLMCTPNIFDDAMEYNCALKDENNSSLSDPSLQVVAITDDDTVVEIDASYQAEREEYQLALSFEAHNLLKAFTVIKRTDDNNISLPKKSYALTEELRFQHVKSSGCIALPFDASGVDCSESMAAVAKSSTHLACCPLGSSLNNLFEDSSIKTAHTCESDSVAVGINSDHTLKCRSINTSKYQTLTTSSYVTLPTAGEERFQKLISRDYKNSLNSLQEACPEGSFWIGGDQCVKIERKTGKQKVQRNGVSSSQPVLSGLKVVTNTSLVQRIQEKIKESLRNSSSGDNASDGQQSSSSGSGQYLLGKSAILVSDASQEQCKVASDWEKIKVLPVDIIGQKDLSLEFYCYKNALRICLNKAPCPWRDRVVVTEEATCARMQELGENMGTIDGVKFDCQPL